MSTETRRRLGVKRYDTANYLRDEEEALLYLEACTAEAGDDAAYIAKALGTVVRARGAMAVVAEKSGLSRESLYKALSGQRDPSFSTVLKVLSGLGLHIKFYSEEALFPDPHVRSSEPVTLMPHTFVESMIVPMIHEHMASAATTSESLREMLDLSTSRQSTGRGADTQRVNVVFNHPGHLGRFARRGKKVLSGATSGHASELAEFAPLISSHQH